MRIKVVEGTKPGNQPSLCRSCRNSTIIEGEGESETVILCGHLEDTKHQGVVPFSKVTRCSDYDDKASVRLREMEDISWILVTDRNRQKIGFKPASQWSKENPDESITRRGNPFSYSRPDVKYVSEPLLIVKSET